MITALIQARMSSTRLPGKVLLPLGGKTVLENVVERVMRAKSIKEVVVATSTEKDDDIIADLCQEKNVKFFRGSLESVLDRFYFAAKSVEADHICRITADCPLIDPDLLDEVASIYLKNNYDCVAINRPVGEETYPDGVDVEFFPFLVLEKAWREATEKSEKEHVTPYIWKNPEKFKIYIHKNKENLSAFRITLDTPSDYELIKVIYEKVEPLDLLSIVNFLNSNPHLVMNLEEKRQNEGYYKSLKEDAKEK